MGLFENLGRKVEKFKQEAQDASREQASARCAECDTAVYTDREDCPECGSDRLVAPPPDETDSADETGATATGPDERERDADSDEPTE